MKRRILLFCAVIISSLWFDSIGQTYGYEMEMKEFRQISEAEFRFDVYLRKSATSDLIAIENFQFQLNFNNPILNGGSLVNSFLTVDATETDLIGNLAVITDILFTTDGINVQFASGDVGPPGSVVTILDDTWKKVATFIVQLSNGGELHNFGDANPEWRFRPDPGQLYTLLNRCEYTGTGPVFTKDGTDWETVSDRTLIPADGIALSARQLAGYCFTGTSDWLTTGNWNNALSSSHPAYHQVPGVNSNALINGNVTILPGQSISLLPTGGNGGEVTVMTGSELLFTLTGTGNFFGGGIINFWSDGVGSTNLGNPVDLPAGTTITLQAVDFAFPPVVTWTTDPPGSGSFGNPNSATTTYTTIAANVEVIASFSYTKGSINSITESYSSFKSTNSELFASLTIAPGGTLTVDKLFNDNENGVEAIVLQSADGLPNGSLINANSGVEASVEQFLVKDSWHLIGQPVAYSLIDVFDYPPGGPYVWLYPHLEATNSFPSGSGSSIWELGTPMELGKGYLSWLENLPDPATGEKVTFTGELNAGDYSTGTGFYALEYTTGAPVPGFNLISNPYPSSLQGNINSWTKTNVDNAIWIWEGNGGSASGGTGNYRYWNGIDGSNGYGLGTITGGIIPPMQGFFVKANNTGASLTLPQSNRTHGSQPFYKNTTVPSNTLRIDAEGNGGSDAIFVRFDESATQGYDSQYDVYKMFGSDVMPQLYTNIPGEKLSINTLPGITSTETISLGFECMAQGIFTLTASELESFDEGVTLYLEDLQEDCIQCLNENPQYSFVNGLNSSDHRFVLHFGMTSAENKPDLTQAQIYSFEKVVYLDLKTLNSGFVTIQNILGQTVYSAAVHGSGRKTITLATTGVYLVSLMNDSGQVVEKRKVIIQ